MQRRIQTASLLCSIVLVGLAAKPVAAQNAPVPDASAGAHASNPDDELKIVGKVFRGAPAPAGMFRFHAAIGIRQFADGPYDYLCGASLVATRWLVSASHCFKNSPAGGLYKAQIATINIGFRDAIAVDQVYVYRRAPAEAKFLADIVLLHLASDAPAAAAPIAVQDEAGFDTAGHERSLAKYTVLGFGESTADGEPVSVLQFASGIPSEPSDLCRALDLQPEGKLVYGDRVVADTICAGDTNNPTGSDACRGDSGGGLVYDMADGRQVLAGVVSGATTANAFGCNSNRIKVGLYSRIASYHDQIVTCIASIGDPACRFVPMPH
jgi:secreted trypsin-like serine protease